MMSLTLCRYLKAALGPLALLIWPMRCVVAQVVVVEPTIAGDVIVLSGGSVKKLTNGQSTPLSFEAPVVENNFFCLSPSGATVTTGRIRGEVNVFAISTGSVVEQNGLEKVKLCSVERVGCHMIAVGYRAIGHVTLVHDVLLGVEAIVLMAGSNGDLWTELAILGTDVVAIGMCPLDERSLIVICSDATVWRLSIDFATSHADVRVLRPKGASSRGEALALCVGRERSLNITIDPLGLLGVWGRRLNGSLALLSLDSGSTWIDAEASRLADLGLSQQAEMFPLRQSVLESGRRITQVGTRDMIFRDAVTDTKVRMSSDIIAWNSTPKGGLCVILDSMEVLRIAPDGNAQVVGKL